MSVRPFRHGLVAAAAAVVTIAVAVPAAASPPPAQSAPSINIHISHTSVAPRQKFEIYGKVLPESDAGQVVHLDRYYPTLGEWHRTQTQLLKRQMLPKGNTALGYVFHCDLPTPSADEYRIAWPEASDHAALMSSSVRLIVRGTRATPKIHVHTRFSDRPGKRFTIYGPVTPRDVNQKVNLQVFDRGTLRWAIDRTTTLHGSTSSGGTTAVGYYFILANVPALRTAFRVTWPESTNHGSGISRVLHIGSGHG